MAVAFVFSLRLRLVGRKEISDKQGEGEQGREKQSECKQMGNKIGLEMFGLR